MGCFSSKTKEPPPKPRDEAFVDITVRGYTRYLMHCKWMPTNLRRIEFEAFGHTLVNLLVQNMEEASKKSVNDLLRDRLRRPDFADEPHWLSYIGDDRLLGTEGVLDKGLERLLLVFFLSNPDCVREFSTAEAGLLLRQLAAEHDVDSALPSISVMYPLAELEEYEEEEDRIKQMWDFGDITEYFFRWFLRDEMEELFKAVAEGKETMSPEQLMSFLQLSGESIAPTAARGIVEHTFAGQLTYPRFACYFGAPQTNGVLDPQRGWKVYQDMRAPLPCYSIFTHTVTTHSEFLDAVLAGARAFVIHLDESTKIGELRTFSGPTLREVCMWVRDEAMQFNNYPVILVFPPTLSKRMQAEAAVILNDVLDDRIAKGLMFEGAAMDDPGFTPSALKGKVLVMSTQAPLKPFVGLVVSDMVRTGLGVRVTTVKSKTPAARAGLKEDDWITHINTESVQDKTHLRDILTDLHLGDEVAVRKENLRESTLVVGGAVDQNATAFDKSFSDLVFLKLHEQAGEGVDQPWESSLARAGTDEVHPTPLRARGQVDGAQGETSKREVLGFTFVQDIASVGTGNDLACEEAVAAADGAGAQFIDNDSSPAAARWARGKFSENARCGYVLQEADVQYSAPVTIHFRFLGAPTHLTFPGEETDEPFHGESMKGIDATVYGQQSTNGSPLSPPPAEDADGLAADVCINMEETYVVVRSPQSVVMIRVTFHERVLETSLPADLIRTGYHAMYLAPPEAQTDFYRVMVCVRREGGEKIGGLDHSFDDGEFGEFMHSVNAEPYSP